MLKTLCLVIGFLIPLMAVQEDYQFNVSRTRVAGLLTEWRNLEKSSIEYKANAERSLKILEEALKRPLPSSSTPDDKIRAAERLLRMIDIVGGNEDRSVKSWFSTSNGFAVDWPISYDVCAGHSCVQTFNSHSDAVSFGERKRTELHHQDESIRVTRPVDVEAFKLGENVGKAAVATYTGVIGTGGTIIGGSAFLSECAAIAAAVSAGTGGVAAPVAGAAFLAVWTVGWAGGHGMMCKAAVEEYNNIQYRVTWGYYHRDHALRSCDNKRQLSKNYSTQKMIDLLDSLALNVRIFIIEQKLSQHSTLDLRQELSTLRLQLGALDGSM